MNTPTIQDVNDLGCCCPFPECPGNRWKHQDRTLEYFGGDWKRWKRPAGADDADELPEIYATRTMVGSGFGGGHIEEGTASLYQGWTENPTAGGEYGEYLQDATISAIYDGDALIAWSSNEAVGFPITSLTGSDSGLYTGQMSIIFGGGTRMPFDTSFADNSEIITADHYTVSDDVYRHDDDLVRYYTTASHPSLQGVGGSLDQFIYFCDVLVGDYFEIILSDAFTKEDFVSTATTELLTVSFDPGILTDLPISTTDVEWPIVGDQVWPPLDDIDAAYNNTIDHQVGATADLLGTEYKVGIPEEWETANDAWIAWTGLHAAWEAADPETRGDEPIRGGKRSVFECEWTEGFFPKKWEEYTAEHGDWDAAMITYGTDLAAWEALPEEERGLEPTAPTEPAKPTDPADRPQAMASRSWAYGGPGASAFSDYFQMTQPPMPGVCRPVNMRVTCYHAAGVGVKPTAHGEQIDFANP